MYSLIIIVMFLVFIDICVFKVQALVDLWTANGKSVVEKLKQRPLAPKQVLNQSVTDQSKMRRKHIYLL